MLGHLVSNRVAHIEHTPRTRNWFGRLIAFLFRRG
jgi:hypothetical protein